MASGEHLNHEKVHYAKASDIRVSSYDDVQLNLDGSSAAYCHLFVNYQQRGFRVPDEFYGEQMHN